MLILTLVIMASTAKKTTNHDIVDVYVANRGSGYKAVVTYPTFFRTESLSPSVYNKIKKVHTKVSEMRKHGQKFDQLKAYLEETFNTPTLTTNLDRTAGVLTPRKQKLVREVAAEKKETIKAKRKLANVEKDNDRLQTLCSDLQERYNTTIQKLDKSVSDLDFLFHKHTHSESVLDDKIEQLEVNYEELSANLGSITNELLIAKEKLASSKTRNIYKKMKRRDQAIEENTEVISQKAKEIGNLEVRVQEMTSDMTSIVEQLTKMSKTLKETTTEVEELKFEKRKLSKKISYLKGKLNGKKTAVSQQELKDVGELNERIKELNEENRQLHDLVSLLEDHEVVTFEDGKYTDEVRETIMTLLSMNVSMTKVNEVIKTEEFFL